MISFYHYLFICFLKSSITDLCESHHINIERFVKGGKNLYMATFSKGDFTYMLSGKLKFPARMLNLLYN